MQNSDFESTFFIVNLSGHIPLTPSLALHQPCPVKDIRSDRGAMQLRAWDGNDHIVPMESSLNLRNSYLNLRFFSMVRIGRCAEIRAMNVRTRRDPFRINWSVSSYFLQEILMTPRF